jgi:hypothetical protein
MLAREGITDVSLNVYESNLPAKYLYAAAGYELSAQYPTMRQLRKCLDHGELSSGAAHGEASHEREPL